MKKIVLTIVAMLSMTMAFANDRSSESNALEASNAAIEQNYDMNINLHSLISTLDLYSNQVEAFEYAHNQFVADMNKAGKADVADRKNLVRKAAIKELKYMSQILDNEQYRKFNTLLNMTLTNRGLLN